MTNLRRQRAFATAEDIAMGLARCWVMPRRLTMSSLTSTLTGRMARHESYGMPPTIAQLKACAHEARRIVVRLMAAGVVLRDPRWPFELRWGLRSRGGDR